MCAPFRSRPPSAVTSTANTTGPYENEVVRRGLTVLHSPDTECLDRRVVVERKLSLGRDPTGGVDLVIRDDKVSHRHALIEVGENGDGVIRDLGSRNGTHVDGRLVSIAPLKEGSIVRMGETLMEFGTLRLLDHLPGRSVVGGSTALTSVLGELKMAAPSALPILLIGEPGTGKSLLASRAHELSGRKGAFVSVNCGAIPAELVESYLFGHRKGAFTGATTDSVGFFEKASGGTIFLDEVGALGLAQQPKLLQVLESETFSPVGSSTARTTDARIVAATNSDLRVAVDSGAFRHDLFTRLSGFEIVVAPLRERRSDIPALIRHFVAEFAPGRSVEWTARSLEELLLYPWPGNVRELRFLVQRLTLYQDISPLSIRRLAALLPPASSREATGASSSGRIATSTDPKPKTIARRSSSTSSDRPSPKELAAQLARFEGNVMKVAAHYGKAPKQIYRWMDAYGIEPDEFRHTS